MIDLPPILSAEAGVKSIRSGFASIFDPAMDITADTIKEFYADPAIMRDAVYRLKRNGFTVLSSNKISIDLMGPASLFEEQFDVEIIITEQGITCANKDQFGFIDTATSPFADVLSGIALTQGSTINGVTPPEKTHRIQRQLYEIIPNLNSRGEDTSQLLGKAIDSPVKIAVIDTGFDASHVYFKHDNKRQIGKTNINLIDGVTAQYVKEVLENKLNELKALKTRAEISQMRSEILDDAAIDQQSRMNQLINDARKATTKHEFRQLKSTPTLKNVTDWLDELVDRTRAFGRESIRVGKNQDSEGHGTEVMSVLLQFIRDMNTEVDVIKTGAGSRSLLIGLEQSFNQILSQNRKPDIITSSMGVLVNENLSAQEFQISKAQYAPYRAKIAEAVKRGILIIYAAGNKDQVGEKERVLGPQLDPIISVGGAFWGQLKTDTEDRLYASDTAQGYRSLIFPQVIVPDICGLVGPMGRPMHIVPKANSEEWSESDGTSLAAPQIAGVCAMIKAKFPGVTPKEVREILIRTSAPTESGDTAQGGRLNQLKINLDNEEFSPGLVQVKNALLVAEWLNAFSGLSGGITVKEAVELAEPSFS